MRTPKEHLRIMNLKVPLVATVLASIFLMRCLSRVKGVPESRPLSHLWTAIKSGLKKRLWKASLDRNILIIRNPFFFVLGGDYWTRNAGKWPESLLISILPPGTSSVGLKRFTHGRGEDSSLIPWADLKPNPNFVDWANKHPSAISGAGA